MLHIKVNLLASTKKSQTKMAFFSRTEQAYTKSVTVLGYTPMEINVGKTSTHLAKPKPSL